MKLMFFIASLPEDELGVRQFPLGTGYIGAYVQKHLDGVEVIITADERDIYRERPDILGISSVTQCYNYARGVAERAKEGLGMPIVIGGYHISVLPHRLADCFDIGVMGEGEKPMLEIARLFAKEKKLEPSRLRDIPGICFHENGEVVVTKMCSPVSPLDDLPFPKRNIRRGARNIHLFTSRGCPYRCKFCASTVHWERFRAHSAGYVLGELNHLIKEYDATSIYLLDDLFFADKKRLREIASLMEKEGLAGRLEFHGFITSNLANREVLELAKRIGFRSIRFGAETGSDRLLKEMKGKQASVESHQRCIDLCSELGLEVRAAFMLGTPGETEEDLILTHRFLKRNAGVLKVDGFYLTTPVPGTDYWRVALEKGLVSEDMDWDRLNLDINKQISFDFNKAIYLNEDNVPREKLMDYARTFKSEFIFHSVAMQPKNVTPLAEKLAASA